MPIIDLMAGLREISSTRGASGGGGISKMTVEVSAPPFTIDLNDAAMAGAMALALADQFRTNILVGCKLDGTPAKALAASTIIRREYRVLQGQRNGAAADRYKDKDFRKDARKHFRDNYTTPRTGKFNPATNPHPGLRAVESGMLLASIAAEPLNDKTWRVFFANKRAQTDRSGGSPVGRAFGGTAALKSMAQRMVNQPSVRAKLEFALAGSINAKPGANLLDELRRTANLGRSINEGLNTNNE